MVVTYQPRESVNIQHTMQHGETLWQAVCDAMDEAHDPRTIDEVVYETRKLNNLEGNRLMYLGANKTIIIPCQRNKWFNR